MTSENREMAVPKTLSAAPSQGVDSVGASGAVFGIPERYVFGGTR
jgi:hypothetical protein